MSTLEKSGTPVGSYAPDFELPGIDNQVHHLRRYLEKRSAIGVIALRNCCPYVDLYLNRLKDIQTEFSAQGFTLIGVNGTDTNQNPRESFDNMKIFAQTHRLNFPYLWDPTQDVTRSFGASKTPMAFLIDNRGVVRYKGQIDDNPHNPEAVEEYYLKRAIASLLRGQAIYTTETEAVGTLLVWRK